MYTHTHTHTHTHTRTHMYTHTGNVETGRKEVVFSGHRKGVEGVVGHRGHVMSLAVSSDGQFLVSETHCMICLCIQWNPSIGTPL